MQCFNEPGTWRYNRHTHNHSQCVYYATPSINEGTYVTLQTPKDVLKVTKRDMN